MVEYVGLAGGGVQKTGEDFERGRLPCAIGAEESHNFPGLHPEGDAVDGVDLARFPVDKALERCGKARFPLGDYVRLLEVSDLNGWIVWHLV